MSDLPSAHTGCKPYILSLFAYGKGQLIVWHDHRGGLFIFLVYDDLFNLCRAKDICYQLCRIFTPCDDVDLFTVKFIDNGLYSCSSGPYAGSYGIDILVFGIYCHLGP